MCGIVGYIGNNNNASDNSDNTSSTGEIQGDPCGIDDIEIIV